VNKSSPSIAVVFLARGAEMDWRASCERFLASYRHCSAGAEHSLYVIFKGFGKASDMDEARKMFEVVPFKPVLLDDDSFDIGAYTATANQIHEDLVCMLNTTSEIMAGNWLRKLAVNLSSANVGLVGATGSYESLSEFNKAFPLFPNPHLRSNAFMINRELLCRITKGRPMRDKVDAFFFESGPDSMTRQILALGQEALLVGRNGRGYSLKWWPTSDTFRQGTQSNLLVADNQTRNFVAMPWPEKHEFVLRTWGPYINDEMLIGWKPSSPANLPANPTKYPE